MDDSINLTDVLTLLLYEMITKNVEFNNFDINRILLCCSTNKKTAGGGIYGKLLPLRFENGSEVVNYKGKHYTIPKVVVNNCEILYIMYFYYPKFFNLSARDKINVMFHELYHISPEFNGDIRRMGKVKKAHGHSRKAFEEKYKNHADEFFSYIKETSYNAFLNMQTGDYAKYFKKVHYRKMKNIRAVEIKHS